MIGKGGKDKVCSWLSSTFGILKREGIGITGNLLSKGNPHNIIATLKKNNENNEIETDTTEVLNNKLKYASRSSMSNFS